MPPWWPSRRRHSQSLRSHLGRTATPGDPRALHRSPALVNGLLLAVGLALAVRFAAFWFSPARLPRDFGTSLDVWDVILFAGLTFVVWHRQTMDIIA